MTKTKTTPATNAMLSAGFQWKPEWRKQLPFVRGVHAPPMETFEALLERVPTLRGDAAAQGEMLSKMFGKPAFLSANLASELLQQVAQGSPDLDFWRDALARASCSEVLDFEARQGRGYGLDHVQKSRAKTGYDRPLDWVVRICLARQGLVFTLEVVLSLLAVSRPTHFGLLERYVWLAEMLSPLRQAIACASEDDYQSGFAAASAAKNTGADNHRICAHLFAHHFAWAEEWLAAHAEPDSDKPEYLLKDCALPVATFARYADQQDILLTSRLSQNAKLSMLLLQIHLHQAAALDALSPLLARAIKCEDKDSLTLLLDLLVRLQVPQMPALLMTGIALPKVRTVLEKLATQFPAVVLKAAIEHTLAGRNRATELWTIRLALQYPKAVPDALAALVSRHEVVVG